MANKNIEILDLNKSHKINKKIDQNFKWIINDVVSKNMNSIFEINASKNTTSNIYFLVLNSNKNKEYTFNVIQHENSTVNIYVKVFALNGSNTKIFINSSLPKTSFNTILNQEINGYLLDNNSTMTAIPSMLVDHNKVKASHSVSIGSVDPEKIFYLTSRGISYKNSIVALLKSEYEYLNDVDLVSTKSTYDKVNKIILEGF